MPDSLEGRRSLLLLLLMANVPSASYHWVVCCAWDRLAAANSATNRPSATTDRCMVMVMVMRWVDRSDDRPGRMKCA